MSVVARRNQPTPSEEDNTTHYFWWLWCISQFSQSARRIQKNQDHPQIKKLSCLLYCNPLCTVQLIPSPQFSEDPQIFTPVLEFNRSQFLIQIRNPNFSSPCLLLCEELPVAKQIPVTSSSNNLNSILNLKTYPIIVFPVLTSTQRLLPVVANQTPASRQSNI